MVIEATGNAAGDGTDRRSRRRRRPHRHRRAGQAGHGGDLPRPRLHPQGDDDRRLARLGRLLPRRPRPACLGQDPLSRRSPRAFALGEAPDVFRTLADNPMALHKAVFVTEDRMKLVTFSHRSGGHASHAGVLDGETVACLTEAGLAASVMEIITGGKPALDKVRPAGMQGPALPRWPMFGWRRRSGPGKCSARASTTRAMPTRTPTPRCPTEPFFFAKLPTSVVGPDVRGGQAAGDRADGLRGRVRRRASAGRCTRPARPT